MSKKATRMSDLTERIIVKCAPDGIKDAIIYFSGQTEDPDMLTVLYALGAEDFGGIAEKEIPDDIKAAFACLSRWSGDPRLLPIFNALVSGAFKQSAGKGASPSTEKIEFTTSWEMIPRAVAILKKAFDGRDVEFLYKLADQAFIKRAIKKPVKKSNQLGMRHLLLTAYHFLFKKKCEDAGRFDEYFKLYWEGGRFQDIPKELCPARRHVISFLMKQPQLKDFLDEGGPNEANRTIQVTAIAREMGMSFEGESGNPGKNNSENPLFLS